jgi:phage terminase large subunit GpA-like protein
VVTATQIWTEAERNAWALPEKVTVSEWCDRHRVLDPRTAAEPGPWRTDRTPYLREIMDSFGDDLCEEITFVKPTQVGGTEALYNCLAYAIDQDPGPALLVMPDEASAASASTNRIEPMIELSPALARHVPRRQDSITRKEYRLDRMTVYFAWSNSPSSLASRPIRYLLLDETDKYPKFSGREAGPIDLGRERTRTFEGSRKIFTASTPTTEDAYITAEYRNSDRRMFHVACPRCGHWQALRFPQVKWPEGASAEEIQTHRLARYECEGCEAHLDDRDKARMVARGVWVPAGMTAEQVLEHGAPRSRHRGYWINALYSPWLTLSDVAAQFLKSKGKPESLMNFVNSWLAEAWVERLEEADPDKLAARALDYPEGLVPAGAQVLTAGVDVQKDYFRLVVRAWGPSWESWLIRATRVEGGWDTLDEVLSMVAYAQEGRAAPMALRLVCIDSGHKASEVYDFCRRRPDQYRPVKGQPGRAGAPIAVSALEKHPLTGQALKGGMLLWNVDVDHFKDRLARWIRSRPGEPGQFHLFENPPKEYLAEMCSEAKVIERTKTGIVKHVWRPKTGGAANHYWDCEVYAAAAAEMLMVGLMRGEGQAATVYQQAERQGGGAGGSGGGWVGRGGGWGKRGGGWNKR